MWDKKIIPNMRKIKVQGLNNERKKVEVHDITNLSRRQIRLRANDKTIKK